jgi:hypothetical protein
VLPGFPQRNTAHGHKADVVTPRQVFERHGRLLGTGLTNGAHRFLGQLGQVLRFTVGPTAPALLALVIGINLVIPQEQVRRPDTRAVVTVMQDKSAFGDDSVVQFPSDTMCRESSQSFPAFHGGRLHQAVTLGAPVRQPDPASSLQTRVDRPFPVYESPEFARIGRPERACSTAGFHLAQNATD